MKIHILSQLSKDEVERLCSRNPLGDEEVLETCRQIYQEIRRRGDQAVREFTARFDGVELENFRVSADEFARAREEVAEEDREALEAAARNIRKFHAAQQISEAPVSVQPGVTCWRSSRAIQSVGLYVPGGSAVLPSTVLMLGVPARLAGCSRVVLCIPPRKDGSVTPAVLVAAQIAGLRHVLKIGGAQAIAAMALGTDSVPKVLKILGPGNRWVQAAKLLALFEGVAIDMVAGPTEVLVIADDKASPDLVAGDLLAQAEHGADSRAVVVSNSPLLLRAVQECLQEQIADLPRRELAGQALEGSFAILADSLEQAFEFSNRYAPEHLILHLEQPQEWTGKVQSAGSVFLGPWTPETAGDYASGTNHTLPTSGMARSTSGVSLDSFVKKITFQQLTAEGLQQIAGILGRLSRLEEMTGHGRSVELRLARLKGEP